MKLFKYGGLIIKDIVLFLFCLLITSNLIAQTNSQSVKIAFDVSSADPKVHEATLRHIKGVLVKYPDAEIVVVAYGNGISMVQKNVSVVASDLKHFADTKKVSFTMCQITLTNRKIDPATILEEVTIVPDGIVQLADLQRQGFAYIKESN